MKYPLNAGRDVSLCLVTFSYAKEIYHIIERNRDSLSELTSLDLDQFQCEEDVSEYLMSSFPVLLFTQHYIIRKDKKPIGLAIYRFGIPRSEIQIFLDKEHRGVGNAWLAAQRLVRETFKVRGCDLAFMKIESDNPQGKKLARRLGMTQESDCPEAYAIERATFLARDERRVK